MWRLVIEMASVIRMPYTVSVVYLGAYKLQIYNPKTNVTVYAGGDSVASVTLYEDNCGEDLQFTALDASSNPLNLTDGTVKFKMAKQTASTLKVDGSCVVSDPTNGRFVYTIQTTDLEVPGDYSAEVEIQVSGKIITIGDITVYVKRKLPRVS
jgi:hypothetical protein